MCAVLCLASFSAHVGGRYLPDGFKSSPHSSRFPEFDGGCWESRAPSLSDRWSQHALYLPQDFFSLVHLLQQDCFRPLEYWHASVYALRCNMHSSGFSQKLRVFLNQIIDVYDFAQGFLQISSWTSLTAFPLRPGPLAWLYFICIFWFDKCIFPLLIWQKDSGMSLQQSVHHNCRFQLSCSFLWERLAPTLLKLLYSVSFYYTRYCAYSNSSRRELVFPGCRWEPEFAEVKS